MTGSMGTIFNIQRFSIHDGPGIRTTIFLKGCPLKCAWCANPESQNPMPQLLVRNVKCRNCGKCASACLQGAITWSREGGRRINWGACNQCLECTKVCPFQALKAAGYEASIAEIVAEVEKDRVFYKNSGGGATLSGGEPLSQMDFTLSLAKSIKAGGIHLALDTCGLAPTGCYDEILPYIDLVLFDIKILDPQQHKRFTGSDNRAILENARHLAGNTRMWFRIPIISGFNDSEDHIRQVTALAKEMHVEKISLLPYHEGGKAKSEQIGKIYSFIEGSTPDDSHLQHLIEVIRQTGVDAAIGH